MSLLSDKLTAEKTKNLKVISGFIEIFCAEKHGSSPKAPCEFKGVDFNRSVGEKKPNLCEDCRGLLTHATVKLLLCPYDPKPKCKKCQTHCYGPGYRERIQAVMRFSGMNLIKRGRVDLLAQYYL